MSSANIEVSEIQPQLSRAEQEAAVQYANGLSAELRAGGAAHVEISGPLGTASAPDLARIRGTATRHPVVHVDLTKIAQIHEEGCALLSQELQFLPGNGVLFSGAERIEKMLRQAVDTMPNVPSFWHLLLDRQRLQGKQKKFESIALEYALSVETDPPAWEPVLMPVSTRETVEEKREEPRYQPELITIAGEMTGLKDPQLQALQRFASDRQYVNINVSRLRRIDFVCAGSLANIIAALKGNGKTVRVLHANSLVTTLLRLLKVDENAVLLGK